MPTTVSSNQVERWGIFEITLEGPVEGAPCRDVVVSARFRHGNRVVEVEGFYDGNEVYRVRLMPDALGDCFYETSSNADDLDGVVGTFTCIAPSPTMGRSASAIGITSDTPTGHLSFPSAQPATSGLIS